MEPGDVYGYSCEYGNYSKHRASQAGSILLAQEQLQLIAFSRPQSDRGGRAVIQSQRNQARNPIWTKHAGNFGGKLLTGAQCILGQSLTWDKRAKPQQDCGDMCCSFEEKRRHPITHFRFEDPGAVRIPRHETSICKALRPCLRFMLASVEVSFGRNNSRVRMLKTEAVMRLNLFGKENRPGIRQGK